MAQRRTLGWAELKVGLLVLIGFAILTFAIIRIGGPSSFWGKKFTITSYFASAGGLRPGNDTFLDGLLVGRVTKVGLNQNPNERGNVEVEMEIDATYIDRVRKDSPVTIETVGLLGDKTIQLRSGSATAPIVGDKGTIQGAQGTDVQRIIQGTDDVVANFKVLSEDLTKISKNVIEMSDKVNNGEGTLGKFLTNPELHDNLNKTALEMEQLVHDLRTGPGTAGKFISDDEVYRRFTGLLSQMENMVTKLERGEGTAGKFLNDPAIFDKFTEVLNKMDSITGRIDRGEGSLGKLMKDDAFYNDLHTTLTQVNGLVAAIQNGNGTTGKLITDPTLFNRMDEAMSEFQKLVYDIRHDPKKYLTINFRFF